MSKRIVFSPAEKICLQELITKYKINSAATGSNKKTAWLNLTEEYNSIEGNIRRTEAQLKKCYDNLKNRRKGELAEEKRERMRTGGGSYHTPKEQSTEIIDEALLDVTNIELQFAQDSDADAIILEMDHVQPPPNQPSAPPVPAPAASTSVEGSQELDATQGFGRQQVPQSQTHETRNVRAHVISEEFKIRKKKYSSKEDREEELHRLKVKEREFLVKAAEEQYEKCKLERCYAELVLKRALEK